MTEPVRALIVDDEPLARANLRHALRGFSHWYVVAECASVPEAQAALAARPVDVLFLDIQMPVENGLVLAQSAASLESPPVIIFVTAYEAFAIAAFELHALDYLLKPFDDERFGQAIERAEQLLQLRERAAYGNALRSYLADVNTEAARVPPTYLTRLSVRSVGRIVSIAVADVRWITAAGNYVELHVAKGSILHRVTVSALEKRLDPSVFLRVHRSTIVRREECKSLTVTGDGTYTLRLHSGVSVAVSERYVADVRATMGR
jgi:two-component system, LytTR family, response regulator